MKTMKTITDAVYGGERPLFASQDLKLERVVIEPGESALKECRNIEAVGCEFRGKYPFWHVDGFTVRDCALCEVRIPDAQETLWHCRGVELREVEVAHADYLFMHSADIRIENYRQQGNYSFQYCRNVEIRNAVIDSKDAFWGTEDVTVYDSELTGEYLGWHSKRLRLVNCRIAGTQPLCYATDLVLENCTMADDCDLAFENTTVRATVNGPIRSVKNPRSGSITAGSFGEIILDANIKAPADCVLKRWGE